MNSKNLNRRQLLVAATGVGLGSLIPTSAAQEPKPIDPNDAGKIHGKTLEEIASGLGDKIKIDTRDGMLATLDLLVKAGVVSENDARVLKDLIYALFDPSEDPEKLKKNIEQLWNREREKLSKVGVAILSIARQTVTSVEKYATDHTRQIAIVSSDVLGAMTGALACAELGPIGIVMGAVAGSVAASAKVAFETRH
jgi:hypothetical protein